MSTPEGILKAEVNDFLKKSGREWMRLNSGVIKSGRRFIHLCPAGTADIVVYCPDPRWIELKQGKTNREQKEAQEAFRTRMEAIGHKYLRATCLDEVIEFVK
jgi:hypothetical protein